MARARSLSVLMLAVVAFLLMSGCASAPSASPASPPKSAAAPPSAAAPSSSAPASSAGASQASSSGDASADRMVVRTAYLRLVVADVDDVLSRAAKLAQSMGGYVASSESREEGRERTGGATLRVPADRLDDAIAQLKQMATKVDRETSAAKDVTEEYVDNDARLRTLKAAEEQYLRLLKDARNTDDLLKIQKSIDSTREQIERTQARLNLLKRGTDMATITLSVLTAGAAKPIDSGEFNFQDTVSEALANLVGALIALATLGIWILIFTPIWLPTILIIRWWRRRPKRPSQPPTHGGPPYAPPGGPPYNPPGGPPYMPPGAPHQPQPGMG